MEVILVISIIAVILAFLIYYAFYSKYYNFVIKYSVALKELDAINNDYSFYSIPNYDMKNSYDNEIYYNNISPKDYLTYQLIYERYKINDAIEKSKKNNQLYEEYKSEIKKRCKPSIFNTNHLLRNGKWLNKIEGEIFEERLKRPIVNYSLTVTLTLTTINRSYKRSKSDQFFQEQIEGLIRAVGEKRGNFYINEEVWQSISKVERGKVSNRMRFSIYARDNYTCQKCGRKANDLEIDHIIPIAKGGKSTYDNLQTLCKRCNYEKGSKIE